MADDAAPAPAAGVPPVEARAAFLEQIPEGIRGEAYFKDIHDVGNLANKAFHQAKLIGQSPDGLMLVPTGDDAAAWGAVYDRLGRPEAADKYALSDPQNGPAGLAVDAELKTRFMGKAHEAGLSQKQAAALYEWYNGERADAYTKYEESEKARQEAAIQALKQDRNFGGQAFDRNVERAQAALNYYVEKLGLGELPAELDRTHLGDHPMLVRMFAEIGREMEEAQLIGSPSQGAGGNLGMLTPAEIDQQIAAKIADKEFQSRYHSPIRATRQVAIDEIGRLYELKAEANKIMRGEAA